MSVWFQLVVKMEGDSPRHFDAVVALENQLLGVLDDSSEIDGHDIGNGESIIFVLTEDPREAFSLVHGVLESVGLLGSVRAAFRAVADDHYTVIWPPNQKGAFTVT